MITDKVVAFIPARGGSQSIPKKNIKEFCGKPLIYWNIKELNETQQIGQIIVSTDSDEIIEVVRSFNIPKVKIHKRTNQNSQNQSSTESAMLECIADMSLSSDQLFMLVQCTSPFTRSCDFKGAIDLLFSQKYQSVLSCVRMKRFIWSDRGEALNYDYQKRPRRQEFDGLLVENGALYLSQIKNILNSKNRLSGSIGIWEMPSHTFIEIDEPEDWEIAQMIFMRYK